MNKARLLILFVLLILLSTLTVNSQETKETKTILILFGLSPSQPAYRPILDGIRLKLTEEFGDEYNFHLEYLDYENQKSDMEIRAKIYTYNEKYREIKLDLLICVGRNIITPLKNNAESYLLNLPTISIDFDFSNFGYDTDLRLNEQTALIGIQLNIIKMISTSLSIFPSTSTIYFIGGTSRFDKFMMKIAEESAKKISQNKKIVRLTDMSMDMILQQVRNLPEGSLIFIPSYNTDSKSVTYYNPEAIRLISSESNSPVFAYSDMGFGDGSVGGYILSFKKIGLLAGDYSIKILKGTVPNSLIAKETDYYENIYDWRQLKRWNLLHSGLIPEGSNIAFVEVSYFDKYKWIFGIALLFLVLQSLLIANLIRLNRNQKLMTKQIIKSENRYREFLHVDRSLRLGHLTASLSHELNQPLTAILSNAQAAINFINSNEATPELLKQILQKIVENDKRTAAILSSIRGMLKLESRQKEKVNLISLINEVIGVTQSEASKNNIKLIVESSEKPVYVIADGIQIQQVLLNFILNAIQSMEKIKVSNKVIAVTCSTQNGEAIISVKDNGNGIDDSIKENLFKPFTTSKKDGTGIGLVVCHSIIEDHNGKIWAENMSDGGAKFSFSLNLVDHEQN